MLIADSLNKGSSAAVALAVFYGWLPRRKFVGRVRRAGYFLLGAIASFATLATRNLTTVLAGILIFSFVFGFTPTRALRWALTSFPIPGKTNCPFFLVSLRARSEISCTISPATRRDNSNFSA